MSAKNASDALGLLKVVENASNDVTDMLQRVRELAVQAASGTNSINDIKNLQGEADALMTEITRVSSDTTYNGKKRIGADAGTINIQVGYNNGDQIALKTYSIAATDLTLTDPASGSTTVLTANKLSAKNAAIAAKVGTAAEKSAAGVSAANAMTKTTLQIDGGAALTMITAAIDKVSGYKAEWGAGQNRLEDTVSNLMNVVEFTSAARSRIEDADFAVEAAKLATAQVIQQMAAAMLAQANAAPQLALQLIKQL